MKMMGGFEKKILVGKRVCDGRNGTERKKFILCGITW